MIQIAKNIYNGQSRGCWLCIQIRYTMIYFLRLWDKNDNKQGIRINIAAPVHNPELGYRCLKYGIKNYDRHLVR